VFVGDINGKAVGKAQPEKLAALESQWETVKGAPFSLLLIPDVANERNSVEMFQIPKFLSFLVYDHWDSEVKGLKEWPKGDRPPVELVFWAFRLMVGLGFLFCLLAVIGWFKRNKLERTRWYLRTMVYVIPLPYLSTELGWIVTEVGRQPWIVYGVMKTAHGVSPIAPSQVALSLAAFVLLYSLLGLTAFALMARVIRQGPPPEAGRGG
jgi:cytochrome d ubiquinol oxidase subunit I